MSYSETQLDTWSHQGSTVQSAATYATIRNVLEDSNAPYSTRDFTIFLQGSYGNDTNIYADSDVDIVICLNSVFYTDLNNLDASQRSLYETYRSPASYSWSEFRSEVLQWLSSKFGSSVVDGKKAITINGDANRRDADVLVCAEHRRYNSYRQAYSSDYNEGIVFWDKSNREIVNFPKQHQNNCTAKNQGTSLKFKPVVRILKNYRNHLITNSQLSDGVAPSYFIEGLLWNMPSSLFQWTYLGTVSNFVGWMQEVDSSQLSCANDLHWLVRDGPAVCWPSKDFNAYVTAVKDDW